MKRIATIATALAILATGCGADDGKAAKKGPPPPPAKQTVVDYMTETPLLDDTVKHGELVSAESDALQGCLKGTAPDMGCTELHMQRIVDSIARLADSYATAADRIVDGGCRDAIEIAAKNLGRSRDQYETAMETVRDPSADPYEAVAGLTSVMDSDVSSDSLGGIAEPCMPADS